MNNVCKSVQEELVVNLSKEGGERVVKICKGLPEEEKRRLISLLREYEEVFT